MVTPAGTAIASPQTTTLVTGWLYLNTVRYRFPPGPMGCLGFYITSGNNQIIPFPPSQRWIVGEDEEYVVDYKGSAGSGLQCVTANVGTYQHELLLTIEYYDVATVASSSTPPPFRTSVITSELLNNQVTPSVATQGIYEVREPQAAG